MTPEARKKRNEYMAKWRAKNRDYWNAYYRKWRKANKDKVKMYQERYWAKKAREEHERQEIET